VAVTEISATADPGDQTADPFPASPRPGPGRAVRLVAYVAAGALAAGAGFGVARILQSPGPAPISSVIPRPAQGNDAYVEDDDGPGQDSQTNILQSTAPGLVHVISAGTAAGIGLVLTPSGKVLTTYLPAGGAGGLRARYVVSGVTFKARVIGTDATAGLALLQLEGGDGRPFATLQVGNSATLADAAYRSKELAYHVAGEVDDTAIGTVGLRDALTMNVGTLIAVNRTVTVDGQTRTGLLQSALQSPPTTEIGGPLVDLTGRVIGIMIAGTGSGLHVSGYALPINQALAVASQIDARAGAASS
jgi:S1-C subfamily serine protease